LHHQSGGTHLRESARDVANASINEVEIFLR
jgi:hypothetical protein